MKTIHLLLFMILGGLLLGISWPETGGLTLLSFVGFVPFLLVEHYIHEKGYRPRKAFWLSYVGFIVFNAVTQWWIYIVSPGGAIMTIILSSLLMSLTFWFFHLTKRKMGVSAGYAAFILYFMAFEWLHYHSELSHPWLNLGNVFASKHEWIQWYEYTGVQGGSLWILISNLMGFTILKRVILLKLPPAAYAVKTIIWLLLILLPILYSFSFSTTYEDASKIEVVVVQPNFHPDEKYNGSISSPDQIRQIISLAEKVITPSTDFVVAPETAITHSLDENNYSTRIEANLLRNFLASHPTTAMYIGASSHRVFQKNPQTESARLLRDGKFVEYYNTGLLLKTKKEDQLYHKTQLVLGTERIPYIWFFKYFESFAIDLGGVVGSLGTEKDPQPLGYQDEVTFAPVICYEQEYGQFVADFVRNGAQVLFVITNDSWWGDSPGYKQHYQYARLRAIETRRSIVRSANTGWSGIFLPNGDDLQKSNWDEATSFLAEVPLQNQLTFYAQHGDFLYRPSFFISLLLFLYSIIVGIKSVGNKQN